MNQRLRTQVTPELCPIFPGSIFSGGPRGPLAVERYAAAWQVLKGAADLSPANPDINRVLSRLVDVLSEPFTASQVSFVLNYPAVLSHYDDMLALLNLAESAMERHFSAVLCNHTRDQFLYMENYRELVATELQQLRLPSLASGQSIAFVGAGPLPLSAILLVEATGVPVTCIDNDPGAVRLGRSFIERSGLCGKVRYIACNGTTYDYANHPVVFIASLVEPKDRIIARIRQRSEETEIAVRSAQGVHKLLYRPVCQEPFFRMGVRFERETVPNSRIINTTLFTMLKPVCASAEL